MRHAGISFSEVNINLRDADAKAQILAQSPAGKVPALLSGDRLIWDSLAILEYLAEEHPEKGIWPADRQARAVARCVSAEIHSGFAPLRRTCSMELLARNPLDPVPEEVRDDIRRIIAIWGECRANFGDAGHFLFGAFSAADAYYAPVVRRFLGFAVKLPEVAAAYVATMDALPAMRAWVTTGLAEHDFVVVDEPYREPPARK